MTTTEIKIRSTANREWMLHEHHGWTRLVSEYGTRAEFDAACQKKVLDAANDSSYAPTFFDREDYVDGGYEKPIKDDTTHLIMDESGDLTEFTSDAAAKAAYSEALAEHGLNRLTCDRGGHSGPSERVNASDIRVYVTTPSGEYKFDYENAESAVEFETLLDAGIPTGEIEAVRTAIEAELATILAE